MNQQPTVVKLDILSLLKKQGRTLNFAASFLQVHPNSMRSIAKRKVIPRLDRAARLSILTGKSLEDLYPELFEQDQQETVN